MTIFHYWSFFVTAFWIFWTYWIHCQWLRILRKASHWQLIQNSGPFTTVWRQCDIRIVNVEWLFSVKIVLTGEKGVDESQSCFLWSIIQEILQPNWCYQLHIHTSHTDNSYCFDLSQHLFLLVISLLNWVIKPRA